MVLNHQKPLIFQSFFHRFSLFFQNHSPGPFLDGPSAELVQQVVLGCHFRFSWFSKKAPFGPPFHQSRRNKRSAPNGPDRPSRDPAFHETVVITVPFGPSVFLY